MTREIEIPHKVAILATGDEISQGDIVNSNSQEIALRLVSEGMHVRMHMVAPDSIHEIEEAMQFLLNSHQALIITGGLGPTSDDLTRYALSKILDLPLVFDQQSWDAICERLSRLGYFTPPESNRQQALFPEGSTIIPNIYGTASGCMAKLGEKFIFMLPGPPSECLPMVDHVVLPTLKNAHFQHTAYHRKWFMFGVSEGQIAEELDALTKQFDCVTGYRIFYPYVEFKVHSQNQQDFTTLVSLVEKTIQPHLIGDGQHTASTMLRRKLADWNNVLYVQDHATGGALEAAITTPKTRAHLKFSDEKNAASRIEINGLSEYWQEKQDIKKMSLEIIFNGNKKSFDLPYRGNRSLMYAVEFICRQIYEFLSQMK